MEMRAILYHHDIDSPSKRRELMAFMFVNGRAQSTIIGSPEPHEITRWIWPACDRVNCRPKVLAKSAIDSKHTNLHPENTKTQTPLLLQCMLATTTV